jgi:3-oxoacyl-[acyl-carrier protein] reductase
LLPGTHKTSRIEQLVKDTAAREKKPEEDIYREMVDAIPCKKIGDPADFGAAAAFLAANRARYITGQNLLIDGGRYGGLL